MSLEEPLYHLRVIRKKSWRNACIFQGAVDLDFLLMDDNLTPQSRTYLFDEFLEREDIRRLWICHQIYKPQPYRTYIGRSGKGNCNVTSSEKHPRPENRIAEQTRLITTRNKFPYLQYKIIVRGPVYV
ncbi:hypothetical protein TNCV_193031 [Trichonephila clavipes]|nr:hypothetical protein TNCV_193031 [Trichonephila clavipes]